jgi:outer membrane immunogenic protein
MRIKTVGRDEGNNMKKLLVACVAAAAFCGAPAFAADMAVKAPAPVAPPSCLWCGVYVGVNAGWSHEQVGWAFDPPVAGAANQSYNLTQDKGVIGLQAGVQWQFSNWVLGAEVAWDTLGNNLPRTPGYGIVAPASAGGKDSVAGIDPDGIFMVGPRAGWVFQNNFMLYADGGFAGADIAANSITAAGAMPDQYGSQWHRGWFAGGGLEYAVSKVVILGVDYRHVGLNTITTCSLSAGSCAASNAINATTDLKANVDMVTFRASLKFNP